MAGAAPRGTLHEPLRVLGVSGSPRPGATNVLVQAALMGARDLLGATTEFVALGGRRIDPCNGCDACNAAAGCLIDDDMQPLYDKLLAADAIILGSPVYYGGPSALCKAFMERVQGLGIEDKPLRLKVGGAIASGGSRHGGQESTLASIHLWFHIIEMIPLGMTAPATQWGMAGLAGHDLTAIHRDRIDLTITGRSVSATEAAWMYGQKVATVAEIVRAGRAASGLDVPHRPYGFELPAEFPAELHALGGQPPLPDGDNSAG